MIAPARTVNLAQIKHNLSRQICVLHLQRWHFSFVQKINLLLNVGGYSRGSVKGTVVVDTGKMSQSKGMVATSWGGGRISKRELERVYLYAVPIKLQ